MQYVQHALIDLSNDVRRSTLYGLPVCIVLILFFCFIF